LVDDHDFGAGYAIEKLYEKRLGARPEASSSIFTPSSEEAQVDYGEAPMVSWSCWHL
jgi:hypothetical protein